MFFLVAQGSIDVLAVLPTIQSKTQNIREFLCKKMEGDMLYMPSVKQLISWCNMKEFSHREKVRTSLMAEHRAAIPGRGAFALLLQNAC